MKIFGPKVKRIWVMFVSQHFKTERLVLLPSEFVLNAFPTLPPFVPKYDLVCNFLTKKILGARVSRFPFIFGGFNTSARYNLPFQETFSKNRNLARKGYAKIGG